VWGEAAAVVAAAAAAAPLCSRWLLVLFLLFCSFAAPSQLAVTYLRDRFAFVVVCVEFGVWSLEQKLGGCFSFL
jgi:hypothetical protein